ncbi:MAG: divalent-cation tolerance protein CutA [Thermodesulfobacteriota bacterium]|nr:MAG: divalent-cation tolerance protein CutA [Thermodesulfobacteriota bacterium]
MDGHIVVFTTAQNQDAALQIADAVVSEGLAACCNMLPGIRSVYMWKGEMYDEEEVLCIMKTRRALFDALKARILELHGYEVPEVIAIDIKGGHSDYLKWIDQVTAG